MQLQRVSLATENAVAVVRFSNPPYEYMDDVTLTNLTAVLDEVEGNPDVRAVVLTGASENIFIRHYDVRELESRGRRLAERGLSFSVERPIPENAIHACYRRIEESKKPFIAAVNGTAMGGGLELALSCDLRIVRDGPFDLGLPEINIGLLPGGGGTQRLTQIVGRARALELMLLGKTFSPREAVVLGLASECVAGPILPRALQVASELAARSPQAIAHIKRLVREFSSGDMRRGLAAERTLFCDLMVSRAAIEAMHAMNSGAIDIINGPPSAWRIGQLDTEQCCAYYPTWRSLKRSRCRRM